MSRGPRTVFRSNDTADNASGIGAHRLGRLIHEASCDHDGYSGCHRGGLVLGLEWVLHPVMIFDTKMHILEAYRDYQAQTRATGKATLSSRGPDEIP